MKARATFAGALRALALPAAAALLLGACAGAPQPAETRTGAPASPAGEAGPAFPKLAPTQPPADLGAVERYAWQQVVLLGEAFASGDVEGFLARVSRGFYRNYTVLEKSLRELLASSTSRAAVVAVRLVTDEEGKVNVRAEWTRSVRLPDGSVDLRHGETVFILLKSDTSLRLIDYRGDAPFAIDGI